MPNILVSRVVLLERFHFRYGTISVIVSHYQFIRLLFFISPLVVIIILLFLRYSDT